MSTKLLLFIILLFMQYVGRAYGDTAKDGQFPSLVALVNLHKQFIASGCLITTDHIISAARHCVAGKTLLVLAGHVSLAESLKNQTQYRWIVQSSIHPEYSQTRNSFHDVALSRLSKAFDVSPGIHPIKVHSQFRKEAKECFGVGWEVYTENLGSHSNASTNNTSFVGHYKLVEATSLSQEHSNDLQYQQLRVIPNKECNVSRRSSTICALRNSNVSNPAQLGIFLICSKRLCGISSPTIHDNVTISLFENMGKFSQWINRELSLSKLSTTPSDFRNITEFVYL